MRVEVGGGPGQRTVSTRPLEGLQPSGAWQEQKLYWKKKAMLEDIGKLVFSRCGETD